MPALPTTLTRHDLPIWVHLALFALAILLPLWAVMGAGALIYVGHVRDAHEQQTLVLARAIGNDVGTYLAGQASMLRALATSPALQDGDFARFHDQAVLVAPANGAIVMRDRDGQQLVNTLFPKGTKLPFTKAAQVRATDACVLRTRDVCVSDLYTGTTDPVPYVLVDAPVMVDGELRYLLNVGIHAAQIVPLLRGERLPQGLAAGIVDRQHRVIARSRDHDRFVGQLAAPELRAHAQPGQGSFRGQALDGTPVFVGHVLLPATGWRVAVAVPEAVLDAPMRQSVAYVGGVGLVAMLLSLALATAFGKRLARPLSNLSALAGEVWQGATLHPPATRIREVNEVATALAAAATRLRGSLAERDAAQSRLHRLNEELEARVLTAVRAREEAQATAAHAQRMQALGQLAGGIAHDFNNVLQVTTGCAAIIGKRALDAEAVRHYARLIVDASERGSSVTRRLLAFAKQNDLRAEPVDISALLGGMAEMLVHTLGTAVTVSAATAPGLPLAFADKGQLETVLVNLATNARDAMSAGGHLALSAAADTIAAGDPALEPGDYVRITVADTGRGMELAVLARATEPFFTTKQRHQGTGLGLAMARGFAEQSGGRLKIDSEPGRGTTVSLWLRVAPERPALQPAIPPAAPGIAVRWRVLLVDDEEAVREAIAGQLHDSGYDVVQAADSLGALALLDTGPPPDAIITDLTMPGMNGLDLIRSIRRRGLAVPTILLTGHAGEATRLAVDTEVTRNFSLLRKPVPGPDLASRLAVLIGAAARTRAEERRAVVHDG